MERERELGSGVVQNIWFVMIDLYGELPEFSTSNRIIKAVPQEEGVVQLHAYLRGRIPFEEVSPFLIHEARGDNKIGTRFHIGGRIRGKLVTFSFNPAVQEVIKIRHNHLLAFPRQDDQGLYQWIDLHEVDRARSGRVDVNRVLQSYLVDRENLRMKNWGGYKRDDPIISPEEANEQLRRLVEADLA